MNYSKWAQDYYLEAQKIGAIIDSLKSKLKNATPERKQFLYNKISKYREMKNDCLFSYNTLMERAGGMDNAA